MRFFKDFSLKTVKINPYLDKNMGQKKLIQSFFKLLKTNIFDHAQIVLRNSY
jgi:hypothetical protein